MRFDGFGVQGLSGFLLGWGSEENRYCLTELCSLKKGSVPHFPLGTKKFRRSCLTACFRPKTLSISRSCTMRLKIWGLRR